MFLQEKNIVVSCPICGRTATVQSQYIQLQLACSHCQGQFQVQGNAEEFCAVKCASSDAPRPTVFVVEHRDEIFSRIAADIAEAGYRVVRAISATDALKACGHYRPKLVIVNVNLPGQSGWLLACKLGMVDPRVRIWLYDSQTSQYDQSMARHLHVDAMLDYRGNLFLLSDSIVTRLKTDATFVQRRSDSINHRNLDQGGMEESSYSPSCTIRRRSKRRSDHLTKQSHIFGVQMMNRHRW